MSQGTDFISLLDLPYEVKRRLGPDATADLGEWIVAHRQEVIDALVDARVLLRYDGPPTNYPANVSHYIVVQPHTHEWRIACSDGDDRVRVFCRAEGCPEGRVVPNRLPIQIPS